MQKQPRLTIEQQEILFGEKLENIVRYDFNAGQICPMFYNHARVFSGRAFEMYFQDMFRSVQKKQRFKPVVVAIKTVQLEDGTTVSKDKLCNVNMPYSDCGTYVLGNVIVWDSRKRKYRANPNGWVLVADHMRAEGAAEDSLYKFVVFLRGFARDYVAQFEY